MRCLLASYIGAVLLFQSPCFATLTALRLPNATANQPDLSSRPLNPNPLNHSIFNLPFLTTTNKPSNLSWQPGTDVWQKGANDATKFIQKRYPKAHLFRFFGNSSQDGYNCSVQFYDWMQPDDLFTVQLPINKDSIIIDQSNDQIFPQYYTLLPMWYLDPSTKFIGAIRTIPAARAIADNYLSVLNVSAHTQDWELSGPARSVDFAYGFNPAVFRFALKGQTPHDKVWVSAASEDSFKNVGYVPVPPPDAERKWDETKWDQLVDWSWDSWLQKGLQYQALVVVPKDLTSERPDGEMAVLMFNQTVEKYVEQFFYYDGAEGFFPTDFRLIGFTTLNTTYAPFDISLVSPQSDMMDFRAVYSLIYKWRDDPFSPSPPIFHMFYEAYLIIKPTEKLQKLLAPDDSQDHIYYQFAYTSDDHSGSLFVESRLGNITLLTGREHGPVSTGLSIS